MEETPRDKALRIQRAIFQSLDEMVPLVMTGRDLDERFAQAVRFFQHDVAADEMKKIHSELGLADPELEQASAAFKEEYRKRTEGFSHEDHARLAALLMELNVSQNVRGAVRNGYRMGFPSEAPSASKKGCALGLLGGLAYALLR
jgi:hypothetical protein